MNLHISISLSKTQIVGVKSSLNLSMQYAFLTYSFSMLNRFRCIALTGLSVSCTRTSLFLLLLASEVWGSKQVVSVKPESSVKKRGVFGVNCYA